VIHLILDSHLTLLFRDNFSPTLSRVSCFGWVNCVLEIADFWSYMERWIDSHMEETRGVCSVKIYIELALGNPCWQLLFGCTYI
jgi:hypothetical protein